MNLTGRGGREKHHPGTRGLVWTILLALLQVGVIETEGLLVGDVKCSLCAHLFLIYLHLIHSESFENKEILIKSSTKYMNI